MKFIRNLTSGRAWIALACITTASCVSTLGIDQFTSVDCVGVCEQDASLPDVAAPNYFNDGGDADVTVTPDTGSDTAPSDTGSDTADAEDDALDSGIDGCGSLSSPLNCGACGVACDTVNSIGASCNGVKCSYAACVTGHADCDKADAADANTNGCECATPTCCGGGCANTHTTGLPGANYYDCVALGTYDFTQASSACFGFSDGGGSCVAFHCGGQPDADSIMCTAGLSTCGCWSYAGNDAVGHARIQLDASSCGCPTSTDPTWN